MAQHGTAGLSTLALSQHGMAWHGMPSKAPGTAKSNTARAGHVNTHII
jgi:hypothetical protein